MVAYNSNLSNEIILTDMYLYTSSGGWRYVRLFDSEFKQLKSQLEEKFASKNMIIVGKKVKKVGTFDVEIEGVNCKTHPYKSRIRRFS